MQTENEGTRLSHLIMGSGLIIGVCVLIVGTMFQTIYQDQYHDECRQFTQHFDELTAKDCTEYMKENPGATGQQLLDHHSIQTVDEMLSEPIVPRNDTRG